MSSSDMSQYMGVYLDEAREQLELLETHILQMERGDHSVEMLQVLFRAAHTLKGSSRAMGFLAVGDLTHQMENVLDDLRNGRQQVNTVTVDVLLRCLDTLTSLIEEVASTGEISTALEQDVAVLVAQLNALGGGATDAEPSPAQHPEPMADPVDTTNAVTAELTGLPDMRISDYEQTAVDQAIATGLDVWRIAIEIHPDCLMKSVRVYMVLTALEPLGTVLVANPSEEKLDAEDFDRSFQLLFASDMAKKIIDEALEGISELSAVSVKAWKPAAEADPLGLTEPVPQYDLPDDEPAPAPITEIRAADLAGLPESLLKSIVGASAPREASKEPDHPAPAARPASPSNTTGVAHSQTIRVDVARLDNLLNLVGEMVIDRTQIARIGSDLRERYSHDDLVTHLVEATHRIARITSELQEEIMKTRMLPIDGVFQRMPRMVRDLAQKTHKELNFQMFGGETELDRSVLEILGDPLIHLLRNSVDHGIEPPDERVGAGKPIAGLVTLSARHEENHIVIEIKDDGRGIDPVKIKAAAVRKGTLTQAQADQMTDADATMLIFASGFSTAAALSDISGRGVGMDIVKSNIEKLGGRILVESKVGEGTRFTIHLPLTLAIVRALLVSAGGGTYVLPLSSVEEMLRLGTDSGEIKRHTVGGQATIVLRGQTVPLANLADVLCGDPRATSIEEIPERAYVVVIGYGAKRVGLCVDGLGGEQEVVIKSLGTLLGDISGLAGATILGDGRVALIIDIARAVECINQMGVARSFGTLELGAAV